MDIYAVRLFDILETINLPNKVFGGISPIAKQFQLNGINNFYDAIAYVSTLAYKPPSDPFNWNLVLTEKCGTCSTRHALLVTLANELNISLCLGHAIYNMSSEEFPVLQAPLREFGIEYIPESHNFIIYKNFLLDISFPRAARLLDPSELQQIKPMMPQELSYIKNIWYQQYLKDWLERYASGHSLDEYKGFHAKCVQLLGEYYENI